MDDIAKLEADDDTLFVDDISDAALERAATSAETKISNPTVPGALVCLPLGPR